MTEVKTPVFFVDTDGFCLFCLSRPPPPPTLAPSNGEDVVVKVENADEDVKQIFPVPQQQYSIYPIQNIRVIRKYLNLDVKKLVQSILRSSLLESKSVPILEEKSQLQSYLCPSCAKVGEQFFRTSWVLETLQFQLEAAIASIYERISSTVDDNEAEYENAMCGAGGIGPSGLYLHALSQKFRKELHKSCERVKKNPNPRVMLKKVDMMKTRSQTASSSNAGTVEESASEESVVIVESECTSNELSIATRTEKPKRKRGRPPKQSKQKPCPKSKKIHTTNPTSPSHDFQKAPSQSSVEVPVEAPIPTSNDKKKDSPSKERCEFVFATPAVEYLEDNSDSDDGAATAAKPSRLHSEPPTCARFSKVTPEKSKSTTVDDTPPSSPEMTTRQNSCKRLFSLKEFEPERKRLCTDTITQSEKSSPMEIEVTREEVEDFVSDSGMNTTSVTSTSASEEAPSQISPDDTITACSLNGNGRKKVTFDPSLPQDDFYDYSSDDEDMFIPINKPQLHPSVVLRFGKMLDPPVSRREKKKNYLKCGLFSDHYKVEHPPKTSSGVRKERDVPEKAEPVLKLPLPHKCVMYSGKKTNGENQRRNDEVEWEPPEVDYELPFNIYRFAVSNARKKYSKEKERKDMRKQKRKARMSLEWEEQRQEEMSGTAEALSAPTPVEDDKENEEEEEENV